jgi:membrane fusion protein (multidrug efflux system)
MKKIFMLMGICIYLLSACSSDKKEEPKNASVQSFPVISPASIDTLYTKEYVAEIQSVQNVEIRSKIKGVIEKIWVDEGKPVSVGQVIYTINSAPLKIELNKAEAQIKTILAEKKTLEIELENTKKLIDKNIVSKSGQAMIEAKIEATDAKIDEIKADIEGIQLQISYSQIKAPFTGTINRHLLKTGALVEDGTALTTISNNHEVFAYFNVSEKEYLDFARNKNQSAYQQVNLVLADNQPYSYKGRVETIEGEFNQSTGNIAFRARFANPEKMLKHGSSGKVRLNQSIKNAIIIPQKATFEVQDKTYVYIVNDRGLVEQKSVIPLVRLDNLYIVDGLLTSDKVILEGIQSVKVGEKVTTKLVDFRK